jgi:ribosomal protein L12E/L44/L45/RPP1/RPP2
MRNGPSSRAPASGKRGAKSRREEEVVEIEEEEEEEEDYEEEEDEERAKASQLISRLRQVTMEETR